MHTGRVLKLCRCYFQPGGALCLSHPKRVHPFPLSCYPVMHVIHSTRVVGARRIFGHISCAPSSFSFVSISRFLYHPHCRQTSLSIVPENPHLYTLRPSHPASVTMAKPERVLRLSGRYQRSPDKSEEEFHDFLSHRHGVECAKIHERHGILKYQMVCT